MTTGDDETAGGAGPESGAATRRICFEGRWIKLIGFMNEVTGRVYPINRMMGDDEVDANGRDVESVLTAREAEW